MRVVANKPLRGEYGFVCADQEFEVRDDLGTLLLKKGMVRNALPPRVLYETKIIKPEAPEVSPREPFRDMPVPDAKSEGVAPESDKVLFVADISPIRTADPGGRGRRSGSNSGG